MSVSVDVAEKNVLPRGWQACILIFYVIKQVLKHAIKRSPTYIW